MKLKNKKILIIGIATIIVLSLIASIFIYLKREDVQLDDQFKEAHYRIWRSGDNYQVEYCNNNQCQIIDEFLVNQSVGIDIAKANNLIYFFDNNILVARNFLEKNEKQIYKSEPEEKVLNFSLSNNNNFIILVIENGEGAKKYYIFDLINNTIKEHEILFAKKDEQIIGVVTNAGQAEFVIIGSNISSEGQQYSQYITGIEQRRYSLTDNYYPYFTVAHKDNHILYFADSYLNDLNTSSGIIQKTYILDGGHLSSDGQLAIKQNNKIEGSSFYLLDLEDNKRQLLFTRQSGDFLDGFWSSDNKYYIFISAVGYYLVDIDKNKLYFLWSDDNYRGRSLVDIFLESNLNSKQSYLPNQEYKGEFKYEYKIELNQDLIKKIESFKFYKELVKDNSYLIEDCSNEDFNEFKKMTREGSMKELVLDGNIELLLTPNYYQWSNKEFLDFNKTEVGAFCSAGGIYPLHAYKDKLLWKGVCSTGMMPNKNTEAYYDFIKCTYNEDQLVEYFKTKEKY